MIKEVVDIIKIGGEVFKIKKGKFLRTDKESYFSGYHYEGQRSGTLLKESSIEKIKKELLKASKKGKIFYQYDKSETIKPSRTRLNDFM